MLGSHIRLVKSEAKLWCHKLGGFFNCLSEVLKKDSSISVFLYVSCTTHALHSLTNSLVQVPKIISNCDPIRRKSR
jgi:hypothetical protein